MNGSRTRRPLDARSAAEAAFKAITNKSPAAAEPRAIVRTAPLPEAKEQVSLRLDQAVLDHFRAGGPGWQDRINAALRKAAGK
ncbi:BrnA antitoxin family protein [Blastochloris tepida]|jgi:uncharacterized protein (DUF4415 family)|uniref:BrnA antitoxin of type II toxin-antitoxin system n=1 Tax=Blastochloris tepida TaxID=2233851 RepID=A0A348FYD2_9HYPH|nr:BrnA antitoxin family protein [Blastochloris tepida]BBF92315.1 hypothetical protein BLTE_10000 [Blastochloris tepida]